MRRVALALLLLTFGSGVGQAWGQTPSEIREMATERATAHGASAGTLIGIVACESTFRPDAVGDRGRSHGLVQLNDLPTGLLHHFRQVGYSDPYNAWEALDYLARVAVGTWAGQGITLRRWSCYR